MKSFSSRGSVRRHITSAHLIALVALFVALGGISWAAATAPKNSVVTKSIKKNAVTNAKIKNNAVTGRKIKSSSILGSDIKNDSLTGSDINEGSLGTVPSATSAGTANDSFNMVKVVPSSNTNADEIAGRAAATEVPIVSNGTVSVYAKCYVVTATLATHFELIARTSANGAVLEGDNLSDSVFEPAMLTTTPEDSRQITDDETDSLNDEDDDDAQAVSLLGPDGKGISLSALNFARNGSPTNPIGLLPAADSCAFHVYGSLTK